MKLCYLLIVAISTFPLIADSSELCYWHYDKNSQPISIGRKPPFDMSSPPLSQEHQAARDRGERVIVSPSDNCSMLGKKNPSETVKNLGTISVPSSALPQKSMQKEPSESITPVRTMTDEEYQEYLRQNPNQTSPKVYQSLPQPESATSTYPPIKRPISNSRRSGGGSKGCGSRGGPGYRLPSGKCASW